MKNLLFTVLSMVFLCTNVNAQADSYTDFEWDILRLGYASPSGVDGVSAGFALSGEVRYNLTDDISIGLRSELALYGAGDELGTEVELGTATSTVLVGDYYFSNTSSKRAFAGMGLGLYKGASVEVNGQSVDGDEGSAFGISPRVGYEFGHVRLSAEYNLTFDDAVPNYLGVHIGFTLFGGYDG